MIAAAVVPHPPLLVPELAGGAAGEVAGLLHACDDAVRELLGQRPAALVCVGGGDRTVLYPPDAWGSLGGYGVEAAAPPGATGAPTLPLSLTIGRWLLARAGWHGDTVLQQVAMSAAPAEARSLGARLATTADPRAAWLVLGDASNRRTASAPGAFDPQAEPFDAAAATALRDGDPAAVLALDAGVAARLGVTGRAAWQVLAGAAGDAVLRGSVRYDGAPFGVGYLVAGWEPARTP